MALVDEVKNRSDILQVISEYVDLDTSSRQPKALCPFHEETQPSFYISPDKNLWFCFGCHKGGSIIQFVAEYMKISNEEAVKYLAREYGISLSDKLLKEYKRERIKIEKLKAGLDKSHAILQSNNIALDYLKKRGFSEKTIDTFGFGYSRKYKAISVPIYDLYGRVVGFALRKLEGQPKWINTKNNSLYNKSDILYNLHRALPGAKKNIYIVEGYFDVAAFHQAGIRNVVAICGSIMAKRQAQLLSKMAGDLEIILVPDMDEPGMQAAERNIKLLNRMGLIINVIELPRKDAADVLVTDGENVLASYVDKKISSYLFLTKRIVEKNSEKSVQYTKVKQFLQEVAEINSLIVDDITKDYLSKIWNKDAKLIQEYITGIETEDIDREKIKTIPMIIENYLTLIKKSKGFKIYTGYPTADGECQGIYPDRGDILTLLGFTSSGKTTFAVNLINNIAAAYPELAIIFFSLEMDSEDILERLAMISCSVSRSQIEEAFETKNSLFEDVYVDLTDKFRNLRVVDEGSLTVKDMDAITKEMSLKEFDNPVKLLVIDHLDYINIPYLSGVERIDTIVREVKAMAKKNKLAIILLHQVGRGAIDRDAGAPVPMTAGKWSGNVENTSSFVWTINRPELSEKLSEIEREKYHNLLELRIKKSRRSHIKEPKIDCYFDYKTLKIKEWDRRIKKNSTEDFIK